MARDCGSTSRKIPGLFDAAHIRVLQQPLPRADMRRFSTYGSVSHALLRPNYSSTTVQDHGALGPRPFDWERDRSLESEIPEGEPSTIAAKPLRDLLERTDLSVRALRHHPRPVRSCLTALSIPSRGST